MCLWFPSMLADWNDAEFSISRSHHLLRTPRSAMWTTWPTPAIWPDLTRAHSYPRVSSARPRFSPKYRSRGRSMSRLVWRRLILILVGIHFRGWTSSWCQGASQVNAKKWLLRVTKIGKNKALIWIHIFRAIFLPPLSVQREIKGLTELLLLCLLLLGHFSDILIFCEIL